MRALVVRLWLGRGFLGLMLVLLLVLVTGASSEGARCREKTNQRQRQSERTAVLHCNPSKNSKSPSRLAPMPDMGA